MAGFSFFQLDFDFRLPDLLDIIHKIQFRFNCY